MVSHQKLSIKRLQKRTNTPSTASSASSFDPDAWPLVDLDHLQESVDEASRLGKHLFIWDRTGGVASHFSEFGFHIDFIPDMVKVALSDYQNLHSDLEDGLTSLRNSLAQALHAQLPMLVNLGMLAPDFNTVYTCGDIFDADVIFDWASVQT